MRIPLLIAFIALNNLGLAADNTREGRDRADIPGVSIQEFKQLPYSQRIFRIKAVRAVDDDLALAAKASLKSYDNDVADSNWQRHTIKRPRTIFGSGETVALTRINKLEQTIEVAIRGTSLFNDVVQDLDAKAELDEQLNIPIHSGFRVVARGVIAVLRKEFSGEEFRNYKFKLYGHSLGGAVANIVAMYLHEDGRTVALVATFGAPRFTTNEGARKYQVLNQVTFRVVRCDDVVPFLPPPNFFGWTNNSYEAGGNLLLLLRPPYFDYSVGIDIERDFTNQLRLELANAVGRERLALGHRMNSYDDLLFLYTAKGFHYWPEPGDISPVSYQLSLQSKMCSHKLLKSETPNPALQGTLRLSAVRP